MRERCLQGHFQIPGVALKVADPTGSERLPCIGLVQPGCFLNDEREARSHRTRAGVGPATVKE